MVMSILDRSGMRSVSKETDNHLCIYILVIGDVSTGNKFSIGRFPTYRQGFTMETDNFKHCHHLVTSSELPEEHQTLAQNIRIPQ